MTRVGKRKLIKPAFVLIGVAVLMFVGNPLLQASPLYNDSFEAPTYTGAAAPNDPTIIGQNGWLQGDWGTGTNATVRTVATVDGVNALRVGMGTDNEAAVYKTFTTTPVTDGVVDLEVTMRHHGSSGQFFIGDSGLTLGDAGGIDTTGSAARFGFANGQLIAHSDGSRIYADSATNGAWYKFHATIYPSINRYSLEIFDSVGNVVVGADDWISPFDPADVGAYDLLSYEDLNAAGLQNIGVAAYLVGTGNPIYVDNLISTHDPAGVVPVMPEVQWETKAQISFEASEGYAATSAAPGTDLIGQNGWTQGAWGTGTAATARDMTATIGAPDGDNAMRVAGDGVSTKVAVYKEATAQPVVDNRVDVWVDMTSYGGYSYFAVGDDTMVMDQDGSGNPLNDGIGAMFGVGNGMARLIDGDTTIEPGVSLASGTWYQFHAILDLEAAAYSLEVFDSNGNLIIGVDDWVDDGNAADMGEYDQFSFRDTTIEGIQNVGVRAAANSGQSLYLDNIQIKTLSVVPEPSTLAMLLMVLVFFNARTTFGMRK